MRALTVTKHGGGDVLAVLEQPTPEPGPGEVTVAVVAAGVNFIDVYLREGVYPGPTPFVLGKEGAGTVVAVGPGVDVAKGARVAFAMTTAAAAEVAMVPADQLVPVPDEVDLEVAAAVLLQGMTAHFLVTDCHEVGEGTVALVHAAAGGVGQLLTQLIRARGGRVVATAGSPDKLAIARDRGADAVIDYRQVPDLADAVRRAAGDLGADAGVDVAYDGVGAATYEASLSALRPRGMLVLYGGASGQVPPIDPQRLNAGGSLFLTRPSLGAYVATREELLWRGGEVLAAVASGDLDVAIAGRYRLEDAAEAYAALEERRTSGKLLLIP